MKKIAATIIKEWQLMRRDISGLLLLLVMPAALIIVMALIQDAPFKDYQELKFDLLLVDNDNGSVAKQIVAGLKQSKNFRVIDSIEDNPLSDDHLKKLLNTGKYKIGVIIPKGTTAEIVNSANIVVNDIAKKTGLSANLPSREMRDKINIQLYFDPVSKPTFRNAISTALDKYITYSCSNILMQRLATLNKDSNQVSDTADMDKLKDIMQGIGVKEEPLSNEKQYTLHMNSVQHNVPAWAIFGMFFIVIPIAGHIIKEREDGSALRIGLIPNAHRYVTMGKIIFYTLICALQFWLMLAIGIWAMPLFGLPSLFAGVHAWVLLPVSLCIGFAATSFGFFIGTMFKTVNQALPFGSVSVVILSALGGIWVPVEILPPSMQVMASISPLHWSLDAVNQVILRNGNITSVIAPMLTLLATGGILWAAGILTNKSRQ
ncbi:MAG: transporter permease [Flavipsychrobacter sp.]|jgi:ABC-2 type transport system permease protein|nr:transporter permease [Flavipsychrobacter sp.]